VGRRPALVYTLHILIQVRLHLAVAVQLPQAQL
jgi:hypothetical protein